MVKNQSKMVMTEHVITKDTLKTNFS